MRPPSPFLLGLFLVPLDIWLLLRLRDHLGWGLLVGGLFLLGIVLARARPPGWLARLFSRRRAEAHAARTAPWRAALAALAVGAWLLPTPAAPFVAGYAAARCATTEYAHWHDRLRSTHGARTAALRA